MLDILHSAFPAAKVEAQEGRFDLGPVSVYEHEGQWIVATPEAHAHFESADHATQFAILLLQGQVRSAQLFRGETLASTWFEEFESGVYAQRDQAIFLNPWDADEWRLQEGESWKETRTTHTFNPLAKAFESEAFDRTPAEEEILLPDTLSWMDGLGSPGESLKWVVGPHGKIVVPAPAGWRMLERGPEQAWMDWTSPNESLMLRVRNYFRDCETLKPLIRHAVHPSSCVEASGVEDENWSVYRWTMLFSDGEQDMMGIVELFFLQEDPNSPEELRSRLAIAMPKSMMPPADWDMSPPPA